MHWLTIINIIFILYFVNVKFMSSHLLNCTTPIILLFFFLTIEEKNSFWFELTSILIFQMSYYFDFNIFYRGLILVKSSKIICHEYVFLIQKIYLSFLDSKFISYLIDMRYVMYKLLLNYKVSSNKICKNKNLKFFKIYILKIINIYFLNF